MLFLFYITKIKINSYNSTSTVARPHPVWITRGAFLTTIVKLNGIPLLPLCLFPRNYYLMAGNERENSVRMSNIFARICTWKRRTKWLQFKNTSPIIAQNMRKLVLHAHFSICLNNAKVCRHSVVDSFSIHSFFHSFKTFWKLFFYTKQNV